MNVSGPLPTGQVPRNDDVAVTLRLNQRFAAEVLQVAGEKVLLSIDGVRVVARLTSAEQAASLVERRLAQFQVREVNGQVIGLQLLHPAGEAGRAAAGAPAGDLAANLLKGLGLAADGANLLLAKAALAQGLPLTPDLLTELRAALERVGERPAAAAGLPFSPVEAQTAAALKAAGLPLSPGALALTQTQVAPLLEGLTRLRARLQTLAEKPLGPQAASLLQAALGWLDDLEVDWSLPPQQLADQLRRATRQLARPLERELADLLAQDLLRVEVDGQGSKSLALALLRRELAAADPADPLLDEIDGFLDSLRLQQFENSAPVSPPLREGWFNLDVPLGRSGRALEDAAKHLARLRIAYRPGGGQTVDAFHTRLLIQVELEDGEALEVDLAVFEHQVGAQLTVPDAQLARAVQTHLPELRAGLEKLGYQLQKVGCEVGLPQVDLGLTGGTALADLREINIGV